MAIRQGPREYCSGQKILFQKWKSSTSVATRKEPKVGQDSNEDWLGLVGNIKRDKRKFEEQMLKGQLYWNGIASAMQSTVMHTHTFTLISQLCPVSTWWRDLQNMANAKSSTLIGWRPNLGQKEETYIVESN